MDDNVIDDVVQTTKSIWGELKSNKISTSALKKTVEYIRKTLDWDKLVKGDYSYETLVKICGNSIIRYPAIGSILSLYTTDNESKKFIDNVQYNIDKIKEIKSIVKSGELPYINTTSTECISLIYNIIKDESSYSLTANQVFEKLYNIYKPQETYVNLKILIDYTCYFIDTSYFINTKHPDLSLKLKETYRRYTEESKTSADVVFSTESKWKKDLIEHLRKINSDRLSKTSAYPETTLRKILSKNVLLLRHIETYLKTKFNSIPTHIDSLQWFFNTIDINGLKECIIHIANNITPENDRVKSKHTKHHGLDFVKCTIVFFRDRIPNYMNCKKDLYTLNTTQILSKINDQRDVPCENIRRHFYDDEIEKIMEYVKDDTKYTLIFTILKEVGLRIGAIVTLQTKHFINHKGVYLDNCRKLEKGKKYRTFPVGENLKNKLKLYFDENIEIKNDVDSYLFPSKSGKHLSCDSVRNKLIRITTALSIYGHHVHPHAFRHTIVNSLMSQGNKLENVSKFMGHSSISTTEQYYWTTELENIIPTMNIPWLKGSKSVKFVYPEDIDEKDTEDESVELSTDLLVSIIGVYHSLMDEGQKLIIQQRIPNIEQIFGNICEYSMTNSLASKKSINCDTSIKDFT
jgi:site-specific recombinase XerC